jgi:hypothetical protein
LTRDPSAPHGRGVYGIRLLGAERADDLLVDADPGWPSLTLTASVGDDEALEERLSETQADLNLKTGGRVSIDREAGRAEFVVPRPLSDEELIHPYFAPVAAVMSHWLRRQCFHAGAFIVGDGAWAVAGDREAGKSSLLAWLALHDIPVLSDDIVVVESSYAFAGPRSIDLRADAAARFDLGRELGVVGTRPRWRLGLPLVPNRVRFHGWVFLSWGDAVGAERLSGSERLVRALGHMTLRVVPHDAAAHLTLAGLPGWVLRRPKDWRFADEAGELLRELVSAPSSS